MQKTTKNNKLNYLIESIFVFLSMTILLCITLAAYIKIPLTTNLKLSILLTTALYIAYKIFNYLYVKFRFRQHYREYKREQKKDSLAAEVSLNFNHLIKNRYLDRADVITIKNMLLEGLGSNANTYKKYYKFKNDAHFIYTALKDKNLSKQTLKMIEKYLELCASQNS